MSSLHEDSEITRSADRLAAALPVVEPSFEAARQGAEPEYWALLNAVRQAHERFAFDREGRPAAINAVREALPVMERDLFEAVLEDHACELAAVEQALYQFARALARVRK
jgi:hypothetical protein